MKYIDDVSLENKKVILRVDYNVPIENGKILDDSRIERSLKTIKLLLDRNCGLIIMSHLGRVALPEDMVANSLEVVSKDLAKKLGKDVKFINTPVGMNVIKACKELKLGEIILLENTRFCDYPEKLESKNDLNLAQYWASMADAFVVDAFGCLHRSHASVAGISKFLPTYFGLLVKEEFTKLDKVTNDIQRPYGVFMGGAKVDDKLGYIKNILPKCDYLLLGGGIANSFLYALGYDVGNSLRTNDEYLLEEIRNVYNSSPDKIVLPVDFKFDGDKIYDMGRKSINKYIKILSGCKTAFMNGTCGKFEEEGYEFGTLTLFRGLPISSYIVAGGGDTLNAIHKFHLEGRFKFLSTGGGASLEYVSAGHLEAVDFIESFNK